METSKHTGSTRNSYHIFFGALALFVASTALVYGQQFTPLTGIPGVPEKPSSIVDYFNKIFILCIILGALVAVIKITVAGFKYAMSDIITDKGDAKKDIQGALLGLLILLGTYVFLYTINPQLVNLNILQNLKFIETSAVSIPGGPVSLTAGEKLASTNKEQATSDVTSCVAKQGTPATYVNEQNATVFCCWQKAGDCSSTKFKTAAELGITKTEYTASEYATLLDTVDKKLLWSGSAASCTDKGHQTITITVKDQSSFGTGKSSTETFCNQTYQVMSQAQIDAEKKKEAEAKSRAEKADRQRILPQSPQ